MEHAPRKASCVGGSGQGICTVVLLTIHNTPVMNLHKVPYTATIKAIKEKVSERLGEVGRLLPAESIVLFQGETCDPTKELSDEVPLIIYNYLQLSRFIVTIIRRTRVQISVELLKAQKKCLCITTQKPQRDNFSMIVPLAFKAPQLAASVAQSLNCGVRSEDVRLYWDHNFQDAFPPDATLRMLGIKNNTPVFTSMPSNFSKENLKVVEFPLKFGTAAAATPNGAKTAALTGAAAAAAEADIGLIEAAELGAAKTPQQIEFEKKANKNGFMPRAQVAIYAQTRGYSPSKKEIEALPEEVNFKQLQEFLNVAMHPEDSDGISMKNFFSSFDVEVTGDLSRRQVKNILQMWGDEPLTEAEAEEFCRLALEPDADSIPIKSLVSFILEGSG